MTDGRDGVGYPWAARSGPAGDSCPVRWKRREAICGGEIPATVAASSLRGLSACSIAMIRLAPPEPLLSEDR